MRRALLAVALVGLVACGGSNSAATPSTTLAPAPVVTDAPASTLAPGVGPLCANATAALISFEQVHFPDGTIPYAQFANTPFAKLLVRSLNDCSSRIEWLTSILTVYGGNETQVGKVFDYGCQQEQFVHNAMVGIGSGDQSPVPVACPAQ